MVVRIASAALAAILGVVVAVFAVTVYLGVVLGYKFIRWLVNALYLTPSYSPKGRKANRAMRKV